MKIIDKRNDFYDNSCQYSKTPLWVRKERCVSPLIELTQHQSKFIFNAYKGIPKVHRGFKTSYDGTFKSVILGYCGSFIPLFLVDIKLSEYKPNIQTYTNIEDAMKLWNDTYSKLHKHVLKPSKVYGFYYKEYKMSLDGVNNWVNEYNNPKILTDIFIRLKSPIFIVDGEDITVNPNLKSYGIQRVMNPFTVYQRIEMYLGNELVMCNQTIPVFSDELKRDAHGMDKWSFKNKTCPKKRKRKSVI